MATYVYGGVWLDMVSIAKHPWALLVPTIYVELALTLVGDTVTLPFSIPIALDPKRGKGDGVYDPRTR